MNKDPLIRPFSICADHTGLQSLSVREQMDRILNSTEFKATDAQKAFLRYVVEKTLAGQTDGIKGYTVATEVFGRGDDFDQTTDPIVSIQANKLRRALERYYLVAGQNDPVCIDIPKGSYVPLFRRQTSIEEDPYPAKDPNKKGSVPDLWPTILVQSFENLTGKQEMAYMGVGLATEIALEITRYQEIRVIRKGSETRQSRGPDARFVLGGSIREDIAGLKVIVTLTDELTGVQVWGDAYKTNLNPADMISFEERIASAVVSKITCEDGIIPRILSCESRKIPPENVTTYQAFLKFYRFLDDFSMEVFADTVLALHQGCIKEPECGLAWSMLARLYSINYSLELIDMDTPIDNAAEYAKKGIALNPTNQRVRLVMAFVLLFQNKLSAGRAEVNRARQLNPNSLMFLDYFGYLMTLFGDWQQGPVLIRKAIELNPYYLISVHYALWVDWVRQEKYEQAWEETRNFNRPLLFWDPLMKAASLGLLGRIEEGVLAGKDLLACKPDFASRGRVLIEHYIKFDDIVEKVILGLKKVDIQVE